MGTQEGPNIPFRCKRQMAVMGGSSSLVRLQLRNSSGEAALYAHAPLLMMASGVFHGLLGAMEEGSDTLPTPGQAADIDSSSSSSSNSSSGRVWSIPLEGDSVAAWEVALSMLYRNKQPRLDGFGEDPNMVESLLQLADKYDMQDVTERCKQLVACGLTTGGGILTPESVFQWLPVFSRFHMESELTRCIQYISSNKLSVPTECFSKTEPNYLHQLCNSLQQTLQAELTQVKDDTFKARRLQEAARDEACFARSEAAAFQDKFDKLHFHHVSRRLPLSCVALGKYNTYVVCWADGTWVASAGLADKLDAQLQHFKQHGVRVKFASLGRGEPKEELWFLEDDGGTTFLGSAADEPLRQAWSDSVGQERIVQVWFAPGGGWFLKKANGATLRLMLPSSVEAGVVYGHSYHDGVRRLAVGFKNEWCTHCAEGTYRFEAVHPVLFTTLKDKQGLTGALEWVELGPDGTFVALFSRYTMWYGCEALTEKLLTKA